MKKLTLVILTFMFTLTGLAFGVLADEPIASKSIPQSESNVASGFWTKDRMQKAKPHPGISIKGSRKPSQGSIMVPQEDGPPGSIESGPPESMPRQKLNVIRPADPLSLLSSPGQAGDTATLRSITPLAGGYEYPPPQTTFAVLNALYGTTTSVFPYMAVGRVFFSDGTANYSCSGAAIGNRAVLTAGHCVSNGNGKYYKNWIFVPSYKKGEAPYGKWSATQLLTFSTYHTEDNMARDVGFGIVQDIKGQKLAQVVGFLGFQYNKTRLVHWNMFGYPATKPYTGKLLYETQASVSVVDTDANPNTSGIGTKQTQGCSGGPWIKDFVPGSTGGCNYANGVNSYHYSNEPLEIYSPYFDTAVNNLRAKAVAK